MKFIHQELVIVKKGTRPRCTVGLIVQELLNQLLVENIF